MWCRTLCGSSPKDPWRAVVLVILQGVWFMAPAAALAVLLVSLSACARAEREPIFHADFEGAETLEGWSGSGAGVVDRDGGGRALVIERTDAQAATSVVLRHDLPAEAMAGRLITLQAAVKAEDVSERPRSWNGVKVMLVLDLAEGRRYPQLALDVGTYDWRTVTRTVRVPAGTVAATLVLGLEQVTGRAWFDDVTIVQGRPWNGGRRSEVMDRGHDLPRLRGAMHGPTFVEEDFRTLATEWGANHMRWQLNWVPMRQAREWAADLDAYDEWLARALEDCDRAVDLAEELGVLLLIDLHCPPGGRADGGVCRMFREQRYQDKLLEVWDRIARRYQGRRSVWAYEIVNEPVEGTVAEGLLDWRELSGAAIDVIRAIEPGKPVVVEPGPWGGPAGFDSFQPLDIDGIVYSCHVYVPHQFTHQGVHGSEIGVVYPGEIGGERWDQERLREALQPARDYQLEFNVPIYIGEFSAIRWAPDNSAYRYLRDAIELFEEYEWDWAYHAFREWSGWSVEHTTDAGNPEPSPTQTDRERLLRSWFALNERPQM